MKMTTNTRIAYPFFILLVLLALASCGRKMPKLTIDIHGMTSDTAYLILQNDTLSTTDTLIGRDRRLNVSVRPDTLLYRRGLLVHSGGQSFVYYVFDKGKWMQEKPVATAEDPNPTIPQFDPPSLNTTTSATFAPDSSTIHYFLAMPGMSVDSVAIQKMKYLIKTPRSQAVLVVLSPRNATADSLRRAFGLDCSVVSDSAGDAIALVKRTRARRLPALIRVDSSRTAYITYP